MKFDQPCIIDGRPAIWVPGAVMDEIQGEGRFPEGVYRWAAGTYLTGWDGGDVKESVKVIGDVWDGTFGENCFKLGDLQIEESAHYLFVLARPNWPQEFVPDFPCFVVIAGYRPGNEALANNIVKFLQPSDVLKQLYGSIP